MQQSVNYSSLWLCYGHALKSMQNGEWAKHAVSTHFTQNCLQEKSVSPCRFHFFLWVLRAVPVTVVLKWWKLSLKTQKHTKKNVWNSQNSFIISQQLPQSWKFIFHARPWKHVRLVKRTVVYFLVIYGELVSYTWKYTWNNLFTASLVTPSFTQLSSDYGLRILKTWDSVSTAQHTCKVYFRPFITHRNEFKDWGLIVNVSKIKQGFRIAKQKELPPTLFFDRISTRLQTIHAFTRLFVCLFAVRQIECISRHRAT